MPDYAGLSGSALHPSVSIVTFRQMRRYYRFRSIILIAEKHGGLTVPDNLALSCERCNSHKGPNIAGYLEGSMFHCLIPERTAGQTILLGKVRC